MKAFIVKTFEVLFKVIGVLLACNLMGAALRDLQSRAFNSKNVGLVSILNVNQQLVGSPK